MRQSIIVWVLMAGAAFTQGSEEKTLKEWQRLREELRKQGWPVASKVSTTAEMEADITRVRREMEKRKLNQSSEGIYEPQASAMQRAGGGGYAAPRKSVKSSHVEGAKGLR